LGVESGLEARHRVGQLSVGLRVLLAVPLVADVVCRKEPVQGVSDEITLGKAGLVGQPELRRADSVFM